MENAYNIVSEFSLVLPKIRDLLLPLAKRSFISVDAAFLLVVICEFPALSLYFDESVKSELIVCGFVEYNENRLEPTSKGKILSKSFVAAIKKLNY